MVRNGTGGELGHPPIMARVPLADGTTAAITDPDRQEEMIRAREALTGGMLNLERLNTAFSNNPKTAG